MYITIETNAQLPGENILKYTIGISCGDVIFRPEIAAVEWTEYNMQTAVGKPGKGVIEERLTKVLHVEALADYRQLKGQVRRAGYLLFIV